MSNSAPPIQSSSSPITLAPRSYVVQDGDSLTKISFTFYGTGARWQEIYNANRDILKGQSALKPGQRLAIP